MGRNSEVALRQPNAATARNTGTTTSTAAIRHTVENPAEAECTICGHSPVSHIPMEPRYGYRATNAVTRTASTIKCAQRRFNVGALYKFLPSTVRGWLARTRELHVAEPLDPSTAHDVSEVDLPQAFQVEEAPFEVGGGAAGLAAQVVR
jgi:hypothetical protein